MELRNWAGNIRFSTDRVHHPETVGQVQEIVRNSRQVRVLGSRHSFNAIADSTGDLISLDRLSRCWRSTPSGSRSRSMAASRTASWRRASTRRASRYTTPLRCHTSPWPVPAQPRRTALAVEIASSARGWRLWRSSPRTARSERFPVLTTAIASPARWSHSAVWAWSPGSRSTSRRPSTCHQVVYENLPLAQVEEHFDAIMSSGYSVSLFSDWRESRFNQAWIKTVAASRDAASAAPTFYGATRATTDLHPLPTLDPATCTPQMGVVGPWHERLPHFRSELQPSYGEELQSEYFLPRAQAPAALRAIADIRGDVAPLLQMSEVRTIAADGLWMSPFYRRDCVALHFTWRYDWEGVKQLLPRIEERLAPFDARPHWGKLFTIPAPTLQARYERLPDFRALLESFDPNGIFRNTFLETFVFS